MGEERGREAERQQAETEKRGETEKEIQTERQRWRERHTHREGGRGVLAEANTPTVLVIHLEGPWRKLILN